MDVLIADALRPAQKSGNKFLNPVPTSLGGFSTMFKLLPLYMRNREETEPKKALGPFRTDPAAFAAAPESGLRVTWFGHSSALIEIDGLTVLTDPVWEDRASPVQFAGPRRFFAPTLHLEDLPSLDIVLISHDHYDHFGSQTIRRLAQLPSAAHARWVTSLGVGQRLIKRGVDPNRITELDWTQSAAVPSKDSSSGLTITAWPACHFSGRGVLDRCKTLWSSFVLEGPSHRVFFGADSAYWEGFREVAALYDHFDLTMLEIGAFHPLWDDVHMGPDGALRVFQDMGGAAKAGLLMPIHWGLFNLALHGWRQPMERMIDLAQDARIPLWSPQPGSPTEVQPAQGLHSDWWKSPLESSLSSESFTQSIASSRHLAHGQAPAPKPHNKAPRPSGDLASE